MKYKVIAAVAAATMSGVMGLASVASAMEFSVYGSVRAGIQQDDRDPVSTSNIAVGNTIVRPGRTGVVLTSGTKVNTPDNFGNDNGSRFGIRGSEDLGNGNSVGFHIERGFGEAVNSSGDNVDVTTKRHQNAWISGNWGKLTFGQQDELFHNYVTWDQSWFYGGQNFFGRGVGNSSLARGIRYDTANLGPFGFSAMYVGNTSGAASPVAPILTVNETDSTAGNTATISEAAVGADDSVSRLVLAAGYQVGDWFTVNIAHSADSADENEAGESYDNTGIRFSGTYGLLDWYVSYVQSEDNTAAATITDDAAANSVGQAFAQQYVSNYTEDAETIGLFLGLKMTESDTIYLEWEDSSVDGFDDNYEQQNDQSNVVVGYSRAIGPSATFIIEGGSLDYDSAGESDRDRIQAILKVDF